MFTRRDYPSIKRGKPLRLLNHEFYGGLSEEVDAPQSELINLDALLAIARRQWVVVAVSVAASLLLGVGFILTAVPKYTSSATVLMDRGNKQVVDEMLSLAGSGSANDEGYVLSQVEVVKSETVALAVVDQLKLVEDPLFNADNRSILATIAQGVKAVLNVSKWFSDSSALDEDFSQRRIDAAVKVQNNLAVTRIGRSYVLVFSYESPSGDLSAKIVNAAAAAYLDDKLNAKYDATKRASSWLIDRIAELRQQSLATDLAVQKFRTANGLVSMGSNGLVSDQQLSELNSALIVAQADVAKTQARLDRIQEILASGQTDAIVTDVLASSVSNELRTKYLNASKLEAQISSRLGPKHVQAVRLRNEMDDYKRLMFDELSRIAESYRSEYDVAVARQKSLEKNVADAAGVSATANETQVQLRELERESETYKNLYQTFLQRYQEAVQQQSFPVTDARIISRGAPSERASSPNKLLALAFFAVLGASAGAGIGGYREFRDRFFRIGDQVRATLGLEFLGSTPLLPNSASPSFTDDARKVGEIFKSSDRFNHSVAYPLSSFAETLRSCKVAADLTIADKPCKVIGIVSALPGEGKSTFAVNFAELLASQGARTILIDADLRNPGATRAIAQHADMGILESILDKRDPRSLLMRNPKTGLLFLPAVVKQRVPHSSELLNSVTMRQVLADLSKNADYVILDLPPLGPVVDARVMAPRIDGFIMVVEWGKTARAVVSELMSSNHQIRNKCLGVVLTKVDQSKMKLYQTFGSSDYHYSRYSQYYQENV